MSRSSDGSAASTNDGNAQTPITIELDHVGPYSLFDRRRLVERWPLREGAVRSVFVVVRDVGRENVVEVAATEDQDPVEAFAACAADPAFGVRPCCRRPHGRFDDADAFRAEDLVELARELAVAITDQKPRPDVRVVELHQQVARLLSNPAAVGVGRDPGEVDAAGPELDEEQNVEALQEERVDREEVALEDARRLRS